MNWKRIRRIALYASGGVAFESLLLFQQVRIIKLTRDLTGRTGGIVEELRKNAEAGEEIRQNVILLAEETNNILEALRLPKKTFSFEKQAGIKAASEEVSTYLLGVDEIESAWKESQAKKTKERIKGLLKDSLNLRIYSLSDYDGTSFDILVSGVKVFNVRADSEGRAIITSITGKQQSFPLPGDALVESIVAMTPGAKSFIEKTGEMEEALAYEIETAKEDAYFKSAGIVFDWRTQPIGEIIVRTSAVVRKGVTLLDVYPDPENDVFIIGSEAVSRPKELISEIKKALEKMDLRSREEMKIDELKSELTKLVEDKGFAGFIEGRGLRLINSGREDSDYYYYDIYSEGNIRIGAFGIQKFLGELYLVDHEDIPINSIKTILDDDVKKN